MPPQRVTSTERAALAQQLVKAEVQTPQPDSDPTTHPHLRRPKGRAVGAERCGRLRKQCIRGPDWRCECGRG